VTSETESEDEITYEKDPKVVANHIPGRFVERRFHVSPLSVEYACAFTPTMTKTPFPNDTPRHSPGIGFATSVHETPLSIERACLPDKPTMTKTPFPYVKPHICQLPERGDATDVHETPLLVE
jgi:hypothetical protein